MRAPRGFLLVAVMLISLVLFVMGLAFLSSRTSLYRSSLLTAQAAQARALARAGVEDARIKLSKDIFFPPQGSAEQLTFSYRELVLEGTRVVGSYRVTLDETYRQAPYFVVIVRSTGLSGDPATPSASFAYTAYFQQAATQFRLLRWEQDPGP